MFRYKRTCSVFFQTHVNFIMNFKRAHTPADPLQNAAYSIYQSVSFVLQLWFNHNFIHSFLSEHVDAFL